MSGIDGDECRDLLEHCISLYDKLLSYNGRYYEDAAQKRKIIRGCMMIIEAGFDRLMDAVEDVEKWVAENVPGA